MSDVLVPPGGKGGYDDGYSACPNFWGTEPGSLISHLFDTTSHFENIDVLDAGCGEGKNAAFFARRGANVTAIDISDLAILNAKALWPLESKITWISEDIRNIQLPANAYDIVVAYGLFHCFSSQIEISEVISSLQTTTVNGGFNIVCAFNDRSQDLSAHPHFAPTLLSHQEYLDYYYDWEMIFASDTDLHETHPHNSIPHSHSMTRAIFRKRP